MSTSTRCELDQSRELELHHNVDFTSIEAVGSDGQPVKRGQLGSCVSRVMSTATRPSHPTVTGAEISLRLLEPFSHQRFEDLSAG
jgi:hypothetical protein